MLNIKKLQKLSKFSIKKLSEYSGMPYDTLGAKIRRGSELKVNEAQLLEKVLRDKFEIIIKNNDVF